MQPAAALAAALLLSCAALAAASAPENLLALAQASMERGSGASSLPRPRPTCPGRASTPRRLYGVPKRRWRAAPGCARGARLCTRCQAGFPRVRAQQRVSPPLPDRCRLAARPPPPRQANPTRAFATWTEANGKRYNQFERVHRLGVFQRNVAKIFAHNEANSGVQVRAVRGRGALAAAACTLLPFAAACAMLLEPLYLTHLTQASSRHPADSLI